MANGHESADSVLVRKKKPLTDKIAERSTGKRKLR